MLDSLVRYFTKNDYPQDFDDATYPHWIIKKDALPKDAAFPIVEDFEDQFKALWGLSK